MTEKRVYPASRAYLLNVVSDIIELQRGKVSLYNSSQGRIGFSTRMYGVRHQFGFTIQSEGSRCAVELETDGDTTNSHKRLNQMFALLESLMEVPTENDSGKGKEN